MSVCVCVFIYAYTHSKKNAEPTALQAQKVQFRRLRGEFFQQISAPVCGDGACLGWGHRRVSFCLVRVGFDFANFACIFSFNYLLSRALCVSLGCAEFGAVPGSLQRAGTPHRNERPAKAGNWGSSGAKHEEPLHWPPVFVARMNRGCKGGCSPSTNQTQTAFRVEVDPPGGINHHHHRCRRRRHHHQYHHHHFYYYIMILIFDIT